MEKRVTIFDIANAVGVSKTTISRYLNGQYEHMSNETKTKIEQVIRDTSYLPNSLARGLKSKHSALVGVITHTLQYQVVAKFVKGLSDIVSENGYSTIISSSDELLHRETAELKMCLSQQVDAIALIPVNTDCEYYHQIHESGTPIIMCNRYRQDWKYDGVYVDNVGLCRKVWDHLTENGYTKIAFLTDNNSQDSNKALREQAFVSYMADAFGINSSENLFRVGQSPELVRQALRSFVNRYPGEKKAVFAINTNTLYLTLKEIKDLGLAIPQDLGVCGYDLLGWSELVPPGITVLRQPFYELGVLAGRQILRRLSNSSLQLPEEIWLNGTMTVRSSTQ